MFQCLLRQEIAYFDRPENSSGNICSRLASNASALQEMAGTRLGSLIEATSMLFIATILGFVFNIQLTLVSLLFVILIFIVVFNHIKSYAAIKKEASSILERANSVSLFMQPNLSFTLFVDNTSISHRSSPRLFTIYVLLKY